MVFDLLGLSGEDQANESAEQKVEFPGGGQARSAGCIELCAALPGLEACYDELPLILIRVAHFSDLCVDA